MIKPKQLNQKTIDVINARLQDELDARYFYIAAANWCRNKGYIGGEAYFNAEAASEAEHYKKLADYLADWNATPMLPGMEPPTIDFKSLPDIISAAYEMEYALYENYEENARAIFAVDICDFGFLQEFVKIQRDSVIEYSTLINQLSLLNVDNPFDLVYFDREFLTNS